MPSGPFLYLRFHTLVSTARAISLETRPSGDAVQFGFVACVHRRVDCFSSRAVRVARLSLYEETT